MNLLNSPSHLSYALEKAVQRYQFFGNLTINLLKKVEKRSFFLQVMFILYNFASIKRRM
jgi:hypothetical protein